MAKKALEIAPLQEPTVKAAPIVQMQIRKSADAQVERSRQYGQQSEALVNQVYAVGTADINNAWRQQMKAAVELLTLKVNEALIEFDQNTQMFAGNVADATGVDTPEYADAKDTSEIAKQFASSKPRSEPRSKPNLTPKTPEQEQIQNLIAKPANA